MITALPEHVAQYYDVIASHLAVQITKHETLSKALREAKRAQKAIALQIDGAIRENAATLDDLRALREEVDALGNITVADAGATAMAIEAFARRESTSRLHEYEHAQAA